MGKCALYTTPRRLEAQIAVCLAATAAASSGLAAHGLPVALAPMFMRQNEFPSMTAPASCERGLTTLSSHLPPPARSSLPNELGVAGAGTKPRDARPSCLRRRRTRLGFCDGARAGVGYRAGGIKPHRLGRRQPGAGGSITVAIGALGCHCEGGFVRDERLTIALGARIGPVIARPVQSSRTFATCCTSISTNVWRNGVNMRCC